MKPIILYPPTIDWNHLHQRPQQLLKALSQLGCICIFCNINMHKQYKEGFFPINDNLILANNLSLKAALQWARASYSHSPIIAYFTYPPHIEQILTANVDFILFDSVDEPLEQFANWFPRYAKSIQHADIIIASAHALVKRALQYTTQEVHLLPNGCDYPHFQSAQTRQYIDCPPFNQDKPIIGYIGAMAPWLDWSLINTMARCLPNYEFVFIGSLLLQKGIAFANNNMHYLGHKDYDTLPQYMSNFNYCLIPFKLTKMTAGVNPIKFWEYLASGHPVLSTALPEIPHEYVTIISEDTFHQLSFPLANTQRDARITLACENSWTKRAAKLLTILRPKIDFG